MKKANLFPILITFLCLMIISCGKDEGPNVLLVLIDTVRADHLSCHGYHRNTTPNIDSLALQGTFALNCHAQSSWTLPAMTTILSGVSPVVHGAGRPDMNTYGVSRSIPWLPLAFHNEGYRTAAFFNTMFMNEDFGFHWGFQHFDCQGVASGTSLRRAGQTVDDFLIWLDSGEESKPFFAAVHCYDPHVPYNAPEPFRSLYTDPDYTGVYDETWGETFESIIDINSGILTPSQADINNLIAIYDGELAYMDSEIGKLFQELRSRGLHENTIIVVVGDHGEEFLEHGRVEHGDNFYQETTHVPLIIAGPGFNTGRVISESVAQLDIAATIVAAVGIEFTILEPAVNLAETVNSGRDIPASGVLWRPEGPLVGIVSDNMKLLWSVEDDSLEAYDLASDPHEMDVIEPEISMIEAAEYYWATPPLGEPPLVNYSESVTRELQNLGYIR